MVSRNGIEYECNVDGGDKYKGEGTMILTTARVVLVSDKAKKGVQAFDLPLAYIFEEKFKQPIFGANYL